MEVKRQKGKLAIQNHFHLAGNERTLVEDII